jgi:hypothetical protein
MKALVIPSHNGENEVIIYTADIYKFETIEKDRCLIYCTTPEGTETHEYPMSANDLVTRIHDVSPDDDDDTGDFELIKPPEPPNDGRAIPVEVAEERPRLMTGFEKGLYRRTDD